MEKLEHQLGLHLPPTLVFDYPNVAALSAFLLTKIAPPALTTTAPVTPAGARDEAIAIIGTACRFPGDADDPTKFWLKLCAGFDAVGEVPPDRWDLDRYYHPDPDHPGTMNSRHGAFCHDVDQFDAAFFGISPREAARMDPQQRFLLETTWHALENANLNPDALRGSATGVYMGVSTGDYAALQLADDGREQLNAYFVSGTNSSVAAGRVAYHLGLTGPAMVIDTACSSSLTALDLACRALRDGQAEQALVGGVGLLLSPEFSINFSKARMLSPSGRCATFDAAADGYVRGEGCGILVLKPLSRALADGDTILSTVLGSAVNQDGAGAGLTVPNGPAQQQVMRAALAQAGIAPDRLTYLEAHGTGTPLGDPIEVQAAGAIYGQATRTAPLYLGSVKTNMGHLEAAAGVAGVIKTVLSLYHGRIPAHLHLNQANPAVSWSDYALTTPTQTIDWPADAERLAAVSSFGFSGTNAHVILQGPPPATPVANNANTSRHLLLISAKDPQALRALAAAYAELLAQTPAPNIADLCATAFFRRARLPHAAAVAGSDAHSMATALRAYAEGRTSAVRDSNTSPEGDQPGDLAAAAWINGDPVDWAALGGATRYNPLPLPNYPFQRERHWFSDTNQTKPAPPRISVADEGVLPLVGGRRLHSPFLEETVFEFTLDPRRHNWLTDHRVAERIVVAGANHLSWVLDALRAITPGAHRLEEIVFRKALNLSEHATTKVQIGLGDDGFRVLSQQGDTWILHVSGRRTQARPEAPPPLTARQQACRETYPLHRFREHPRAAALHLGPQFQWADQIQTFAAQVLARLNAPAGLPAQTTATLHPGLIDTCFRLLICLLPEDVEETLVPFHIGAVTRHAGTGRPAWCHCRRDSYQQGCARGDMTLFAEDGTPLLTISGFEARAVQPQRLIADAANYADDCYAVTWPKTRIILNDTGLAIPKPEQITAQVLPIAPFTEEAARLQQRALHYAFEALTQLGWDGEAVDAEHLLTRLKIHPNQRRLSRRLLQLLQAEGWLTRDHEQLYHAAHPPAYDPTPTELLCLEQLLLDRCGPHLAEVLRGSIKATDLLFPNGDLDAMTRLYREAPSADWSNRHAATTLAALLATASSTQPRRLLEVGAGTGGLTARVLPLLQHEEDHYLFTDISARFLAEAQQRFATEPRLHYQRLDLEDDIDLAPASYDIVLAANVLHATRDLGQTLDQILRLLAPGGVLLAVEGTAAPAWLDLTFGLTEGWWRFEDRDRRPDHPLLSPSQWRDLLLERGFESPLFTAADDDGPLGQHVILARRPADHRAQHFSVIGDPATRTPWVEALRTRGHAVSQGDDAATLPDQLSAEPGPDHILFTGGLAAVNHDELGLTELDDAAEHGEYRLPALLDAVAALTDPPQITCITRGACSVGPDDGATGLAAAGLWALARTARLEYPHLRLHSLDDDPHAENHAPQRLLPLLEAGHDEPELALRGDAVHVARLARVLPSKGRLNLRNDGAYLITGGAGAIGTAWAQVLVDEGAGRIVLIGRGTPNATLSAQLAAWRAAGATIDYHAVSVCDVDAMAALIEDLDRPLRGVFHAAGVLDDALLADLTPPKMAAVAAPKRRGAWILHLLTLTEPLDYFVCFSSAAALLGSAGQANHAAANAFLDALAHLRRAEGLPALSINWGAWAGQGAADSQRHAAAWRVRGFDALEFATGIAALTDLVGGDATQIGVIPIQWPALLQHRGVQAFTRDLAMTTQAATAATTDTGNHHTQAGLLELVRTATAEVLGLAPTRRPDPHTRFLDLGMDSLTAMELRNRLHQQLGLNLAPGFLFDFDQPATLAAHLWAQHTATQTHHAGQPV